MICKSRRLLAVFVVVIVLGGGLVACGATPEPQVIEKTVVETVIVAGTTEVVERVVTEVVEKVSTEVVQVEKVVTATPEPEPVQQLPLEKVIVSISSKLDTVDPVAPCAQPCIISIYLTGGRLFRLNPDFTAELEMAEGIDFSDDAMEATVRLKEGLLYSDGTTVTAEDVVFAFERNRDTPGPRYATYLTPIESVEAVDERTIVFKMTSPYLGLVEALADMGMAIHPKSQIEADADYFIHPVSAGPYVLKDWTPGDSTWVLEENPNYVRGPMAIRSVELVAVPDQTSRVLQLGTGVIDYVYDLPVPARDSFPAEVNTYPAPLNGQYHVAFNLNLPDDHPLKDARVRQAISLAINRDEINEKAFGGISTPATSFIYPGPPEGLHGDFGKQDLEGARELLAETAFADGFSVELQTWGQRSGWTDAALVIAENLSEVGITVEVTPIEDAVAVANLRAGTYEMQFSGNASTPLSFFKNQFAPGSFWCDVIGYDNPEVVDLLNKAQSATTSEARIEFLHEAQRLAYEDMPLMPISERVVLVGNRVGRDVLFEANNAPGTNPMPATMEEAGQ
jgi:ABC-type transport system substrate-binding protein